MTDIDPASIPPRPALPKTPRRRPRIMWLAITAGAALIIGAGAATGITYGAMAPRERAAEAETADYSDALDIMTRKRDAAVENVEGDRRLIDKLQGKIAKYREAEAEVTAREDAADKRAAELDDREKAVTKTEKAAEKRKFGSGTVIVGTDVEPGTYRAEGGDGCYYAWMSSLSSDADIISNNLTDGTAIADLHDGDIFESSSCGLWTKAN